MHTFILIIQAESLARAGGTPECRSQRDVTYCGMCVSCVNKQTNTSIKILSLGIHKQCLLLCVFLPFLNSMVFVQEDLQRL